jgi:hypothetical protein
MAQQTAVEIFWNQIPEILPFTVDTETGVKLLRAFEQAKEMEKQQIETAYDKGLEQESNFYFGNDYYTETYGK